MLKTHYFFALSLPEDTKERIQELTQRAWTQDSFKKWVHPDDYHITLAFLGDSSSHQLNDAIEHIEAKVRSLSSFSLELKQFGTYGKVDSPRILWMGIHYSQPLHLLRELVYDGCKDVGFQLDSRPFSPHITLGRKWNMGIPFSPATLEGTILHTTERFSINEVVLYRTHIDRSPKYEAIHTIPLQN
ncbi:RNA 2',3'-cyclic phosphodiesterase [Rossellomorea aquimaris]|uniref:RNA 2',3'-cyclic phosphodiesterase n=1 Tax=Rossellomorea aquimaris TaxID=189382 RepID=UPI0007D08C09|nr:RNA 2',3'-cyclic phosphodiesterase [Rossellomorea aquimaris]